MSCCGTPAGEKPQQQMNVAQAQYPVTQQPAGNPGLSYQPPGQFNNYNASGIPSPQPVYNPYAQNANQTPGPQQLAQWGQQGGQHDGSNFSTHSPSPPPMNNGMPNGAYNPMMGGMSNGFATPAMSHSPALTSSAYRPESASGFGTISPGGAMTNVNAAPSKFSAPSDEGKMSISIDFGTTFSGVAYGSSRIAAGNVQQIIHWPGSFETFRKVPTCLLYDQHGQVLAWGLEAKNASLMPGTVRCEWFKLFLEPHALRDGTVDPRLPQLPPGKKAIELIVDFLSCLWEYAKEQITREIGVVADLNAADVWLTVPAAWDAKGCDMMRDAAISARLVAKAHSNDNEWKERLRIISEPEAAAVHCAHLTNLHKLKPSQNFMICDAGGGTVDLAVYKLTGQFAGGNLEIAEMCARSGANCGSIFLDLRFRELVRTLLSDHPAHLDPASLASFMHAFSETDKLDYEGEGDDAKMFHFTTFNVEDPNDPEVGLINGELAIPGFLLRREVFDPVVEQVLEMIENQYAKTNQKISALLLVGGFAGSHYLFSRVEAQFKARIEVIARPPDADTATCRGAAQYGLAGKSLVTTVIAPRSYLMKVKLPAEPEDHAKRPAYIKENSAGVAVCENRLQYLVHKGAIIRKGQRVRTKFCKFSQNSQDRDFVAVLYTSDSMQTMRYSDEGETAELCRWTVDLSSLPTFQRNSSAPNPNGFYTDFELGLELDSCEVRGILIFEGQEWGRVVFDFLN